MCFQQPVEGESAHVKHDQAMIFLSMTRLRFRRLAAA
jgi:hypothetical protein